MSDNSSYYFWGINEVMDDGGWSELHEHFERLYKEAEAKGE